MKRPDRRPHAVCLLLLGGNVGDRSKHLERAVRALASLPGTRVLKRSRLYETAPVGPSRRPYLNLALKVRTTLSPMGLLIEAKRLEAQAGRRPGRRWGARPLDIDLVDCAGRRMKSRWLTLPHPRMRSRAFALAPLSDVDPAYQARLARLNPGPQTVRIYRPHGR